MTTSSAQRPIPSAPAGGPSRRYLRAVVLVTAATGTGGFLFGFDNGSISGSVADLQTRFHLGAGSIGWVTSSLIVGCMIGVALAGRMSDLLGRKTVLALTAAIFLIGALGETFATGETTLVIARIVVGLSIGAETTIAPLYLAEVAPPDIRGRLVSFNQLFNTVGNLVIFAVSAVISDAASRHFNVHDSWRVIFATGVVPAIVFILLLRFIPESPRWLVKRGRRDEAERILERLGSSPASAADQLTEIDSDLAEEHGGVRELLSPRLRRRLLIGFGVALFQQITGINAIFYYAPEIFKSAGLPTSQALSSTVLVGAVLVAATLVSMWIIDRVGRRTLLLFGAAGMTVLLAIVGLLFRATHPNGVLLIVAILADVAVFAVSFGTIAYVLISELFPTRVRGAAASIATMALWGGDFCVSQFFPSLVARIDSSNTFFIFAGISLLALIFTAAVVPETKGRTLEEISRRA